MALDKLFLTNFNQSFTIEYAMSFLHKIHQTKQSLLYPISLFAVLLFAPNLAIAADGVWFDIHIMAAALTSGVFAVAFLLAVVIYFQARHLHSTDELLNDTQDSWINRLPPMLAMERLLVRVLVLGFVLLSGLILTGMFFGEAVWGMALKWNHKTLFTVLAWMVIAVLLLGRKLRGWRGLLLVRSTIIGFVLLFLAYVGTHLVMDVILHR